MIRLPIAEPARYYHRERTIVVRKGLLLEEERRYLWHELVHADRADELCHTGDAAEQSVDREAARRAMPLDSLLWAATHSVDWEQMSGHLKVPEEFVRFRYRISHPTEKAAMLRASRVDASTSESVWA